MQHQQKGRLNSMRTGLWRRGKFTLVVLTVQLFSLLAIILDVPVVRQIATFSLLTFVPGILILRILGSDEFGSFELLLSVGFSVAFLMIMGVLTNELLHLAGVIDPLSQSYLFVILNATLILLCLVDFFKNKNLSLNVKEIEKNLSFSSVMLFTVFIALSVVGTVLVNASGGNFLIFLLIILVSGLILLITIREGFPARFYPLILLCVAIALLFQNSLVSQYIHGFDIHGEYYVFGLVKEHSYWNPSLAGYSAYADYNSMLSDTVLPTVYSNMLNMDQTWVLKIIFPLIYAFVPLSLYVLYKMHVDKKIAFLSAFFFIANVDTFLQPVSNAKQMIAELFYVLLFIVMLQKNMKPLVQKLSFLIFGFALITSHYGTADIFLLVITVTWLYNSLRHRARKITVMSVALLFTIAFSWDIYLSFSAPFDKLLYIGTNIYNRLADFFNPGSRGSEVEAGLGLGGTPSYLHTINRYLSYATEFMIVIGFVVLLLRRRKFDPEYRTILYSNMIILVLIIIVPALASSLRMGRFYNILLLILSPLFVIGSEAFFQKLFEQIRKAFPKQFRGNVFSHYENKITALALISVILVPFFLFQSGLIFELGHDDSPTSPSLSLYRMGETPYLVMGFVHESDVFRAYWLQTYKSSNSSLIYTDLVSLMFVLKSYGMVYESETSYLFANDKSPLVQGSYVFLHPALSGANLSSYNLTQISLAGMDVSSLISSLNLTQISSTDASLVLGVWLLRNQNQFVKQTSNSTQISMLNSIYSNGDSEMYIIVNVYEIKV